MWRLGWNISVCRRRNVLRERALGSSVSNSALCITENSRISSSGGMRQRVSLARAMSIDPEIVLLDESFSQLDHTTSRMLREDFVGLVREFKKTCVLITHRIDDAIEMADRIVVLAAPARIKLELLVDRENVEPELLVRLRNRITATLADAPDFDPAVQ